MQTEDCLPDIKITKESLACQVKRYLREAILNGTLKPGSKLPSVRTIAKRWGTTGYTVCSAIQALEKDGLLESYDRRGTYVRESVPPLTDVGVYYRDEFVLNPDIVFPRFFYRLLKDELLCQGLRVHLWIDPRTQDEEQKPWPHLVETCRRREIQGVISPPGGVSRLQIPWLLKLPVPVSLVSTECLAGGVTLDAGNFVRQSVQSLARQGCQSVGLITSANLNPISERKAAWMYFIPDLFRAAVAAAGCATRDAWICGETGPAVDPQPIRTVPELERFGREKFMELWASPERPDGIVVASDDMAQGVFQAIQEAGVRVPEELKVTCLRNLEVPQPSPFPVTWIVVSMRDTARALIDQVQCQYRGEPTEHVLIGFREESESDRAVVVSGQTEEVDAQTEAVLA